MVFATSGAAAAVPEPQTCSSRIESFIHQYAKPQSRLMLTFTGPQKSLMPLDEAASGPHAEVALFPIDRTLFVLTIQFRVIQPNLDDSIFKPWTRTICQLAEGHGARFNGVLAFSGNDMTGADMSPPPQK
jgi:hypothetical protein